MQTPRDESTRGYNRLLAKRRLNIKGYTIRDRMTLPKCIMG